jgi:nitroreductase
METTRNATASHAVSTGALTHAATVALRAPSIHNTQPWRWRIHDTTADLYADAGRQLHVSDPDRRMLTISCGVALHHARVALATAGTAVEVDLLPTVGDADQHVVGDHLPPAEDLRDLRLRLAGQCRDPPLRAEPGRSPTPTIPDTS